MSKTIASSITHLKTMHAYILCPVKEGEEIKEEREGSNQMRKKREEKKEKKQERRNENAPEAKHV